MVAQSWFKRAVFYQIDTRTFSDSNADGIGDLRGITERLDYLHSLGVDAILLRPLASSPGQPGTQPSIDPALGTLPDLDDLTLQASHLNIRIVLELPTPDPGLARFWLTRGVAGIYVPGNAAANSAALDAIRKLLPGYVGQRVLITDADPAAPTPSRPSTNELVLYRVTLNSAVSLVPDLRTALDQSQALLHSGTPILAIDDKTATPPDPRLDRIHATALLLNRSAALISAGQELGFTPSASTLMPWGQTATPIEEPSETPKPTAPVTSSPDKYTPYVPYVRPAAPKKPVPPGSSTAAGQEINPNSLLNFYNHLARLHHGTTALRDGEEFTFNHDDHNALIWMRKPASPSPANPPILVACNLSDKPTALSLKPDVLKLQLRGTFLRTVLRSDDLMGGVSLNPITLPPFGVYVGQLRY